MPFVDVECTPECGYVEVGLYTNRVLSEFDKNPPKCPTCGKKLRRRFPTGVSIDTKAEHPRWKRPDERLKVKNKEDEERYERFNDGDGEPGPGQRF
jgi:RecA-family ATPase